MCRLTWVRTMGGGGCNQEHACHSWQILVLKISILDPYSLGYVSGNAFGFDMTHLTLSKRDSLAWSRPAIFIWFLPYK